ncbi:hypothetical protein I6N91_15270 [Arthrobacter sp. MSA 4-2]|uniref:hypothetical protein n=1 Tax=Arthrobacter sp. MSA 4-2 TaxID=2794349 RepID=UPI0018E84B19|nr:hypothetical protein [Arthrobacter sp. MSA 4-2]MBJ2122341.1 hypothetical protein [Arthrobacter sp. MSA 4-2]
MFGNADKPPQVDFHPWPSGLTSRHFSLLRRSAFVVLVTVLIFGAYSTELTLIRVITNCLVVYVVVIWSRRWLSENRDGPGQPGPAR